MWLLFGLPAFHESYGVVNTGKIRVFFQLLAKFQVSFAPIR